MAKIYLFSLLTALILSCNDGNKYRYAISDFRRPLQPHLHRIVTKGIVRYRDSALKKMATDKELVRLALSEHPVLRASAFREMLERKSFDQFDLIVNHLDDTALVLSDQGEFGLAHRNVSDDILLSTFWNSRQTRHRIVEKILREHNYLSSAYSILEIMEPQEDLYPYIKEMATRPGRVIEGYEMKFSDIEYAMYGLAKFRRQSDVPILQKKMIENVWQISYVSLKIIEEYPDPLYFEVLEEYHRKFFYGFSGNRRGGFSGFEYDNADPEDFIRAVVMQKSVESAWLLNEMLSRLPKMECMHDKKGITNRLIRAIWEQPCPEYAGLRQKIKPEAERLSAGLSQSIKVSKIDSSGRIIHWYN